MTVAKISVRAGLRSRDGPLSVRARPSSLKRDCDRRTTSTREARLVNVHAKSRLIPEPLRTLRSEDKGQAGACPDRTRAIPCTVRTVTRTPTESDGSSQRQTSASTAPRTLARRAATGDMSGLKSRRSETAAVSPRLLPILLPRRWTTPVPDGQLWNVGPAHGPQRAVLDDVPTPTDQKLISVLYSVTRRAEVTLAANWSRLDSRLRRRRGPP